VAHREFLTASGRDDESGDNSATETDTSAVVDEDAPPMLQQLRELAADDDVDVPATWRT